MKSSRVFTRQRLFQDNWSRGGSVDRWRSPTFLGAKAHFDSMGGVILRGDRTSLCPGRVTWAVPDSAASRAFHHRQVPPPHMSALGLQAIPELGPCWMPLGPTWVGPQQGLGRAPGCPALRVEQNPRKKMAGSALVPRRQAPFQCHVPLANQPETLSAAPYCLGTNHPASHGNILLIALCSDSGRVRGTSGEGPIQSLWWGR